MSWEHAVIIVALSVEVVVTGFVGHLACLAYRSSKQIEDLTAATFLEARKALLEHRQP